MEELATETNGNGGVTAPDAYPGFVAPEQHTLPSGAVFLLRKPQILKMLRRGQIPNPLMEIVNRVFVDRDQRDLEAEAEAKGMSVQDLLAERQLEEEQRREKDGPPPPQPEDDDELTVEAAFSFMDVVVWAAIVSPRVEMEPPVDGGPTTESGALSFDALSDEDIQYILAFANAEVATAARFPADDERATRGDDSREVRAEAEPVVGHPA